MKPKKSLGQNFLTSIPARNAIVKAGNIVKDDTILEIGPGKGMLTEKLLESEAKVIAVEKDTNLITYLSEKFADKIKNKQFILINEDILKYSADKIKGEYKIVANIPYNITGAIMEKFLSDKKQPSEMVLLVQKEVAERIVARDEKESILSLSIKVYGEPKIVYRVNKGSFFPIPKVDSAVIHIKNISKSNFKSKKHEERFFEIVKVGFSHKRKVLISNLKGKFEKVDWKDVFLNNNLDEKTRAEDVNLKDWLNISNF